MYQYDALDQAFVDRRVAEFRDQMRRHLAGELSEDEFRPLRLRNGLYVQRHAPMLRIAIPYGLLAARQLAKLADIARRYDRGFGHFTTRQNLQLNWPKLADVPDILAELATVQMHAIQTSGNCVRNVTADHLAGIAPDEVDDPRPYCEIIRQWATLHPEFTYLPRKFKIAVTGSPEDRAASEVHDIGLHLTRDAASGREPRFKAWYRYNTRAHRVPGYRAVFVALKAHGHNPGDMSSDQMDAVASLAERVSFGLIRTTHNQNLLLADVRQKDLYEAWLELERLGLAMPNIGTLTDMIACPGLDFCSLANAGTLGVARQIQE